MDNDYSYAPETSNYDDSENFFNNVQPARVPMDGSDIGTIGTRQREVDVFGQMHNVKSFSQLVLQTLTTDEDQFGIQTDNEFVPLHKNTFVINSIYRPGMEKLSDQDYLRKIYQIKKTIVEQLIKKIFEIGFETPKTVQTFCLIPLIQGRDAIIQSPSGTGKTGTMIIGSLYNFDVEDPTLQLIVLTSTRELAQQIHDKTVKPLVSPDAKVVICVGKGTQNTQTNVSTDPRLERQEAAGAQIIICTLGKLYGYMCESKTPSGGIRKACLNIENLKTFCVDEFDTILCPREKNNSTTMNSKAQIDEILRK